MAMINHSDKSNRLILINFTDFRILEKKVLRQL